MKKYRVADLQIHGRYFWDGYLFGDKKEIVDGLLDYHSIDFSGTDDKENELDIYKYLEFYKQDTMEKQLKWVLEYGDWELEEVEVTKCLFCNEDYVTNEGHYNCEIVRTT